MPTRAWRIVFIDPVCPAPYDHLSVRQTAVPEAAASVAHLAQALAQAGASVVVYQHGRARPAVVSGVWFFPLAAWAQHAQAMDAVVHVESLDHMPAACARFPQARALLWRHTLRPASLAEDAAVLTDCAAWVVAVSDHQLAHWRRLLRDAGHLDLARRVQRIHDACADGPAPAHTRVHPLTLACVEASPAGRDIAMAVWQGLRARAPGFALRWLTADGELPSGLMPQAGLSAQAWGTAASAQALAQCLALLVPPRSPAPLGAAPYAQALALGVPVLAHAQGSALELLRDPRQVINAEHASALVATLWAWSQGQRPRVGPRADLWPAAIAQDWARLLAQAPPQPQLRRVAVVTPTWQRAAFLAQAHRMFDAQQVDHLSLRWFVLDDSPEPATGAWREDPRVDYRWQPTRLRLGAKRNALNDAAQAWGADFIGAMDDDDWYGPHYVQSLVDVLDANPQHDFAGSEIDHYWEVSSGQVAQTPLIHGTRTCNGVMMYRRAALLRHRYDDQRAAAEESSFLGRSPVAQHPDPAMVHLALAHASNTVTKRNYFGPRQTCTLNKRLEDFVHSAQDVAFYRGLQNGP